MSNVTKCHVCNKTLSDGDFCDDLQCPNPTPQPTLVAAEGAEAARLLRGWAKAYRDTPEYRFPSDPNAEFFPVDLERAAYLLTAPPKPAPDAVRADYVKDICKQLRAGHQYSGIVDPLDTAAANLIEALYLTALPSFSTPSPSPDWASGRDASLAEAMFGISPSGNRALVKGDRKAIARLIYEAGSPFSSKYAWIEAFRVTDSILALLNK